ncbi:MAG: hypothetical protein ACI4WM_08280 [Erysipelotrichaceae bacterium]
MNYFKLTADFKKRYLNTHKVPDINLAFDELKSFSGEYLRSYHLKADSKDYIFVVPGYNDFYDLAAYTRFKDYGYNVVFIGYGKNNTLGLKESIDLLQWIDYYVSKDNEINITLLGLRDGANIVIKTLRSKLPGNVKNLIFDNPYGDLINDLIRDYCHEFNLNQKLFRLILGINSDEYSIRNDLKDNKLNLLFIFNKNRKEDEYRSVLNLYNSTSGLKKFFYTDTVRNNYEQDNYFSTVDFFIKDIVKS